MSKKAKTNILLLVLVAALIVVPLVFNPSAEYGGTDDSAGDVIAEVNPKYKPWFESFYEPPSGEIESLLFSVQAAIGAGIIGYVMGLNKGKKSRDEKNDSEINSSDANLHGRA